MAKEQASTKAQQLRGHHGAEIRKADRDRLCGASAKVRRGPMALRVQLRDGTNVPGCRPAIRAKPIVRMRQEGDVRSRSQLVVAGKARGARGAHARRPVSQGRICEPERGNAVTFLARHPGPWRYDDMKCIVYDANDGIVVSGALGLKLDNEDCKREPGKLEAFLALPELASMVKKLADEYEGSDHQLWSEFGTTPTYPTPPAVVEARALLARLEGKAT